jgi:thioredoxin-like negative regulator of GroEL
MDKKTWTSPELVDWLHAHALAVRIDRDKEPGRARSLGVQTIPAVVLLDGKKPLAKLEGPQTARDLIDKFNAAIAARPAPKPSEPEKPAEPKPEPAATSPSPPPGSPP